MEAKSGKSITKGERDVHPFSSTSWLYVTLGKFFYAQRLFFSLLKMGGGIPAQLASHSCHGATNKTNNIISGKRTKDAPEEMADSKTRAGEGQGEMRLSHYVGKQGNVQKRMERGQKDTETSLKIKFETM